MAKAGRPALSEEVKTTVIAIHDKHPSFSIRDIKKSWPNLAPKHLKAYPPGITKIDAFVNGSDKITERIGHEKPWNSASLSKESLSPVAVHYLACLQIYRKLCFSKPITVREAKWFNILLNFRENYSDRNQVIAPEYEEIFLSHVIATCAQIYAYREKIDTLADIKNTDYSELDNEMATGDMLYHAALGTDMAITMFNGGLIDGQKISDVNDEYRFAELPFLMHTLGDPDMNDDSAILYDKSLLELYKDSGLREMLSDLPYILRFRFFVLLREWAKEHPEAIEDLIKPIIKQNISAAKDGGMGWEDRNWTVLRIKS